MLGRFLEVVGHDKIDCLVADREFIGAEWFAWLRAHPIAFYIRIRHAMKVSRTTGVLAPARNFFRSLPRSTFDRLRFVLLDRPTSRLWPLALGKRHASA